MSEVQSNLQPSQPRNVGVYQRAIVVLVIIVVVLGATTAYLYANRISVSVSPTSSNQVPQTVTVSGTVGYANPSRVEFTSKGISPFLDIFAAVSNGRYSANLKNNVTYRLTVYWFSSSSGYSNCNGSECWGGCGDFYLYSVINQYTYEIPYNQCPA